MRAAYEACEFTRVPSEKHVAEVLRTLAQQYGLCDSVEAYYGTRSCVFICGFASDRFLPLSQGDDRVNLSRWASDEAFSSMSLRDPRGRCSHGHVYDKCHAGGQGLRVVQEDWGRCKANKRKAGI